MSLEDAWVLVSKLDEPKRYMVNGVLKGVMGSVLTPTMRTIFSGGDNDEFTIGMLRDLIRYRADKTRDLCLVTDTPSAFERLRELLEGRYGFICVVQNDVIEGEPVMYSFYFNKTEV